MALTTKNDKFWKHIHYKRNSKLNSIDLYRYRKLFAPSDVATSGRI